MYSKKSYHMNACPALVFGLAAISLTTGVDARRTTGTAPAPEVVTNPAPPTASPTRIFQLENATIQDIQNAMSDGSLTSVELVNLYLRRIQAYNESSTISPNQPLNSILFLNPNLLEEAAEADRLRKQGTVLSPLHGIPFLVKGSFSVKGMPVSGGVNGWRENFTQDEAWSVTKLREAGAVVMGQANMDNWASSASTSTSQIRGTVRSAYLPGAAPGGSSGGSGVAAGAYLTNFTFGGETGGSIRNPGDRNGLVSYKVSGGSISVDKIIPLVPERDVIGPMTRSAVDNAIIRDYVGEIDPADIWNPVLPILTDKRPVPESGFVSALEGATLAGKKIGIIGTYVGLSHPNPGEGATSNTTGVQNTTAATFALVEQAKLDMEAAGATVEYVFMPPEVSTTYNRGPEAPALLLNSTPYSNQVASFSYRSLIESIVGTPEDTYSSRAEKVIATASLVTNISAARRNMMYSFDSQSGEYSPGEAIPFGSAPGFEHYMARAEQKNAFEAWLDAEGLDAVVWPMYPNKSRTGGTIIGRDLVNFMYLPAVTVPMGRLLQPAAGSNPAGYEPLTMNVTGRLFDDQKVLAIAYAYEQITKHRYSPPLAPPIAGEVFDAARQSKKDPSSDVSAPVLSVTPFASRNSNGSITFYGTVADAGGVDRLEVSIAGALVPAVVNGSNWNAVLPASSAANAFVYNTTSISTIVLAVDRAGNASTVASDVVLPAL